MTNRFDTSRDRVLAAHAAMAAAERECLQATADEVTEFCVEAGLGHGMLAVFHAVPRGVAVWEVDDQDCSRQDAVLEAVDLADVSGRLVRLTRRGLFPLAPHSGLLPPRPVGVVDPVVTTCFPFERTAGPWVPNPGMPPDPTSSELARPEPVPPDPVPLGGQLWQRAVLVWVDLHRALACWTGRWLAANLVVAPETGDIASLDPLYCPDQGQDFEVVTSLRLAPESVPVDDLEAALIGVLEEPSGVTPDTVEFDLRVWLDAAGIPLPGFPAHGPGECQSSTEEC